MGNKQTKVVHILPVGLKYGHGICGRRSFKSYGKKNDFFFGIFNGQFKGIERRIDNSHIAAGSFDRKQILRNARDAQHVPK